MIAQLAELFLERRLAAPAAAVSAARRVLVVDATGEPARLAPAFEALEARSSVRVGLVRADRLDAVPPIDVFDAAWLVVGPDVEAPYAQLLAGEVSERLGVQTRVISVGGEQRDGWIVLDASIGAAGLPWRRRRALEQAADRLAELAR